MKKDKKSKDEHKQEIAEMLHAPGMPRPISINVAYDKLLQQITKTSGHPVYMSEGATFVFLLQSVLIEYPEIEKKYKPGKLGFLIDGTPPKTYTPLFDGDQVTFFANK